MAMVHIFPSPRRHTTPDDKFLRPRRRSESHENATSLYRFEIIRSLPMINLRHTLSHRWLGPERNVKFLRWMKKHFDLMHLALITGNLLTLVVVASPRSIGQLVGPITAVLSLTSLLSSMATASLDVMRLLSRYYEFWFFSAANLVTWVLLAFFLADPLRVVGLIPFWLNVQLTIAMDANFRTFVIAVRSNIFLLVVLLAIGALVFLQGNALATLIPFIVRVLYTKRKLFSSRNAGSKLVRCQLYKAQLVLRPVRYSRTASLGLEMSRRNHVLHKQLGISAPEMTIAGAHDTAQHHQQITLVALRLSAIDARKTVLKSWPVAAPGHFSTLKLAGIYATGAAGLALTLVTLTLPSGGEESVEHYMIPALGLVFSVVFVSIFACASQRDMLRALLLHNFGFVFSMMHCSVACLCVADVLNWDYRCWAVLSAFLWFIWVQLLDAVTPPVRRQLRFSKVQVVPVLWLLWVMMLSVAYASVFLPTDVSGLEGRDLLHLHFGENVTVFNTKSVLVNRLFIMFFWMQRHAWNVFKGAFSHFSMWFKPSDDPTEVVKDSHEEELSTMRGFLEYFCPFDTFPGLRRKIASLRLPPSSFSSCRRHSLTGRHQVRRISSAVLLSGVGLPTPEQRRKTRRGAFGQRSTSSHTEHEYTNVPVREKTDLWSDSVPGTVRDE
eukprot:jgi/Phyca11/125247/e_gw1.57.66.1